MLRSHTHTHTNAQPASSAVCLVPGKCYARALTAGGGLKLLRVCLRAASASAEGFVRLGLVGARCDSLEGARALSSMLRFEGRQRRTEASSMLTLGRVFFFLRACAPGGSSTRPKPPSPVEGSGEERGRKWVPFPGAPFCFPTRSGPRFGAARRPRVLVAAALRLRRLSRAGRGLGPPARPGLPLAPAAGEPLRAAQRWPSSSKPPASAARPPASEPGGRPNGGAIAAAARSGSFFCGSPGPGGAPPARKRSFRRGPRAKKLTGASAPE